MLHQKNIVNTVINNKSHFNKYNRPVPIKDVFVTLVSMVSVCKSCIVKYLQSSKFCPQCNIKIHETQPLMNLRPDRTMQDIVYKLVPNLYESQCHSLILWSEQDTENSC